MIAPLSHKIPDVLEPDGGNFYLPHKLQIHSGRFWRCKHGNTGVGPGFQLIGCPECAKDNPGAAKSFWDDMRRINGSAADPRA